MVWINTQCSNQSVPPGTFGGSMCVCPKCKEARADAHFKEKCISCSQYSKGVMCFACNYTEVMRTY